MPALSKKEITKVLFSFLQKIEDGMTKEHKAHKAYETFLYINTNFKSIFLFFENHCFLLAVKNKAIELLEDEDVYNNKFLGLKIECQKIVENLKDI